MRKLFALILLFTGLSAYSQRLAQSTYWFWLHDKEGTGYTIDHPEAFLTQRAIDRRAYQGLAVDERDLPLSEIYLDSLRERGLGIRHVSKWLNAVSLDLPDSISEEQVREFSFISLYPWSPDPAEQYFPGKPATDRFPEPELFKEVYQYGMAEAQVSQIHLDALHKEGYTGKGVVIAALDAGYDLADKLPAFDSLFANGQILYTRDFVTPGSGVYHDNLHGMYVLSIMGGNIPGSLIGTAPGASFILARTENGSSELKLEEAAWIAGAEWADSLGADIINSSLGYSEFDYPEMDYSYEDLDGKTSLVSRAASLLASRGIILCASAGNEAAKDWHYILTPADAENILTVGAVDSLDVIAYFSSRGPTYDNRIKPDLCTMGYQTAIQRSDTTIGRGSGTSFSSPVLAGATACFWQANPDVGAEDLIRILIASGDRKDDPDIDYGFGIPDLRKAENSSGLTPSLTSRLVLYPNPCTEGFRYISGIDPGTDRLLRIFSIQGQLILETEGEEGYIALPSGTKPGLYIVEYRSSTTRLTGRLIVK